MNEKEIKQSEDRANAYRNMMELWAWKDFMKNIVGKEKADAFEAFKSMSEPSLFQAGQLQGVAVAMDRIESAVSYIVSERP